MRIGSVAATVHGRYLLEERSPERLLVSFHGYAEIAEWNLEAVARIPGVEEWSVAAVQALHPFYTRRGEVVASWMTRLDRDLAIADNLAYVRAVLAHLPSPHTLVFAGFSQGAAMAARASAALGCDGLLLLGGDLPPDVKENSAARWPPTLLGRGSQDEYYSEEKFKDDLSFLEERTQVTPCLFAGGHEWAPPFLDAAGAFLSQVSRRAG